MLGKGKRGVTPRAGRAIVSRWSRGALPRPLSLFPGIQLGAGREDIQFQATSSRARGKKRPMACAAQPRRPRPAFGIGRAEALWAAGHALSPLFTPSLATRLTSTCRPRHIIPIFAFILLRVLSACCALPPFPSPPFGSSGGSASRTDARASPIE